MSVPLKIRKFGDGLGLLLTKELLTELNIGEGDVLMPVKTAYGFVLTPYDGDFEAVIENCRAYMQRHAKSMKEIL